MSEQGPEGRRWPGWNRRPSDNRPAARHMQGRRPPTPATGVAAATSAPVRQSGDGGWARRDAERLWVGEALDVVRLGYVTPAGYRREVEVVETRAVEVACVVTDYDRRVGLGLCFGPGTGTRGWALPTTWVGDGEDQINAADRAIREILGWSVHTIRPLWQLARWPGHSDLVTTVFTAQARKAEARQHVDVETVEWYDRSEVLGLLRAGHSFDALTTAVLYWWLTGPADSSFPQGGLA